MKNRGEAAATVAATAVPSHPAAKPTPELETQSTTTMPAVPSTDSAKSTLALKLQQKEKDRRQAQAQAQAPLVFGYAAAAAAEAAFGSELFHFGKRNGVLQPTVLQHAGIGQEHLHLAPHSLSAYQQHYQQHATAAAAAIPTANMLPELAEQEQPVDFSPKNNFTHSAKTSPFEVTGKYAMVA